MIDVYYPITKQQKCKRVHPLEGVKNYYTNRLENHPNKDKLLKHMDKIYTRSQPEADTLNEEFPLIIFSHGLGMEHSEYQNIIEELASHRFCVIAVDHPHSSAYSPFLGSSEKPPLTDHSKATMENVEDIEFVLDHIKNKKNKDSDKFIGKNINTNLIGVFGHSIDGAAAAQICRRNPKIKAGINVDGRLRGPKLTESLKQPFLTFISGEKYKGFNDQKESVREEHKTAMKEWNA